jgi:hypothetical protein
MEPPFKIRKSSRKSQSPAVPSSSSRRTFTHRAPKVRLRHDNSQIQFEPILSSPSNPFVQESQILTERQREMVERHMVNSNMFANLGSASSPSRPEAVTSVRLPIDLPSDALDVNDLPMTASRTPPRTLASLGEMDVFVGSSPTPQARTRSQEAVSDQTSVATPTAVRTVRLDDDAELDSSPPHFKNDVQPKAETFRNNDISEDSLDYRQMEQSFSISFDEGTTIDDTVLPESDLTDEESIKAMLATEIDVSDMPSSTIDLQLTAQIDADMQAQVLTGSSKQTEGDQASRNETEIQDTQIERAQLDNHIPDTESSNTSRIEDSFSSQAVDMGSPQIRILRSSSRISATSSPVSTAKRKSTGRGRGRPKKHKTTETSPVPSQPISKLDEMFGDTIVVAPLRERYAAKETKQSLPAPPESNSMSVSPRKDSPTKKTRQSTLAHSKSEIIIPETNRKRGIRRSASLLSQVETQSQDVVIEDTPAPKRARLSLGQDVSGGKPTPKASHKSQTKRLSHVQVTPKRSSELDSSVRSLSVAAEATVQAANEPGQDEITVGEQKADIVPQPPLNKGASNVSPPSQTVVSTPSRSFAERVILTPRSIINQLMSLKDALFRSSQLVLGRQEEREIDDALFDIRREVHQAGRRGDEGSS